MLLVGLGVGPEPGAEELGGAAAEDGIVDVLREMR